MGGTFVPFKFIESSTDIIEVLESEHLDNMELLRTYDMTKYVLCVVRIQDRFTDGTLLSVRAVGHFPPSMTADGSYRVASGEYVLCSLPTCEQTGTMKCATCRTAFYCSVACQAAHWGRHKPLCISVGARKKIVDSARAKDTQVTVFEAHRDGGRIIYDMTENKDVFDQEID
jgi:hypothetical protein